MGVKQFWKKDLGDFRQEDRKLIASLADKRVAVDTSAWVHLLDGKWDIKYARTSNPPYPHPTIINLFIARYAALTTLGINPIFVFDGKSPPMKKRTNRKRQEKSSTATEQYKKTMNEIKAGTTITITDDKRKKLLELRRDIARPIIEEYASLSEWMDQNDIDYVQAPFEADAQIKQLINEGIATAAITEDGDLVVFGVPRLLSQTKFSTLAPEKSTCQLFDVDELKAGKYNSPIAHGYRFNFLTEISCLSGNDYIDNLPNVGPAVIFGNHKTKKNQIALIDSFIVDTAITKSKTEEEWLNDYMTAHGKKSSSGDDDESSPEGWTPERFIKVRNFIKHYPIFAKDKETGEISLQPLNPLPSNVSYDDCGSYIGFEEGHPSVKFNNSYEQYYSMAII